MFTPSDRDRVRAELLERARRDERVTGAALTGSSAHGNEDPWSDVDIFLGVAEDAELAEVLADWTAGLYGEHDAVHHWDLLSGAAVYRVFLLRNCLHVDVAFTSESAFGARGEQFQAVFGTPVAMQQPPSPSLDDVAGLGWLSVQHADAAIHRFRPWAAEYWVGSVRFQTLTLACLRLGMPPAYARGFDRLPSDVTAPLENAFVDSVDPSALRRALNVATRCFLDEVRLADPVLAGRLEKPLLELGG